MKAQNHGDGTDCNRAAAPSCGVFIFLFFMPADLFNLWDKNQDLPREVSYYLLEQTSGCLESNGIPVPDLEDIVRADGLAGHTHTGIRITGEGLLDIGVRNSKSFKFYIPRPS